MKEFKTGCATVRIHGSVDHEKVEAATIIYLKKVIRCRKQKEKLKTSS